MPVMNDATEQVLILNCRLLSFFLSNPDFQPPSFVLQHPFLSLKLLEKRMRCYCTCPLVTTKHVRFYIVLVFIRFNLKIEHSLYTEVQVLLPVVSQGRFTLFQKCWKEQVRCLLQVRKWGLSCQLSRMWDCHFVLLSRFAILGFKLQLLKVFSCAILLLFRNKAECICFRGISLALCNNERLNTNVYNDILIVEVYC